MCNSFFLSLMLFKNWNKKNHSRQVVVITLLFSEHIFTEVTIYQVNNLFSRRISRNKYLSVCHFLPNLSHPWLVVFYFPFFSPFPIFPVFFLWRKFEERRWMIWDISHYEIVKYGSASHIKNYRKSRKMSVLMRENTDRKKLGIWTLFTQCIIRRNI